MNISFVKSGVEECEQCDKFLIHRQEVMDKPDDDFVRKRTRKTKSSPLSEEKYMKCIDCSTCRQQLTHIKRVLSARARYNEDKCDKSEDMIIVSNYDMQKVILLPRLPGYKESLFTSRLVTINQTFSPVVSSKIKSTGVLWHEAIAGRNDEHVSSAYVKLH